MATRLAAIVPDDVLVTSSPTGRARETADWLLAELPGHDGVEVDDRLREVDFGHAEGLTFDQIATSMPGIAAGLAAGHAVDWPGGESARSVRARARAVWLDARSGRPRLLVTHGGLMRAIIEVVSGRPAMPDIWIGPATVVELARTGTRWRVVSVAPAGRAEP
jgi:probable phosphoglycerate mutase